MELVALNIGYEMGVLPPSLFVILVIMALVTTFMATPLLHLVENYFAQRRKNSFKNESLFLFLGIRIRSESVVCFALLFGDRLQNIRL